MPRVRLILLVTAAVVAVAVAASLTARVARLVSQWWRERRDKGGEQ